MLRQKNVNKISCTSTVGIESKKEDGRKIFEVMMKNSKFEENNKQKNPRGLID